MYRGAIIGFGAVAQNGHTPAFDMRKEVFEICAVADSDGAMLERARACFPDAKLYTSADALLRREKIDFADIACPPAHHFPLIRKCFKKGINVLCEKPLVFKPSQFAKLKSLALEKNLCLFTVHNWKKALPVVKAKELIDAGLIGGAEHIEIHVLRSQPSITANAGQNWRQDPALSGGGIMADHGWHNFYLAYHLAGGKKPGEIYTILKSPDGKQSAETAAFCAVKFGDITSLIYLTWRNSLRVNYIAVYGTKGNIEVRDDKVILTTKENGAQEFDTGDKLSAGSAHPEWMRDLLDDFAQELADDKKRGANLAEAEVCVNLTEKGYKSSLKSKRIVI